MDPGRDLWNEGGCVDECLAHGLMDLLGGTTTVQLRGHPDILAAQRLAIRGSTHKCVAVWTMLDERPYPPRYLLPPKAPCNTY